MENRDIEKYAHERNETFDFMRIFCVIWIVGFWHMKAYIASDIYFTIFSTPFTFQLTYAVLASFTFISGYFAHRQYCGMADVFGYYAKRMIRIWPLFALAALSLVAININVGETLPAILLGAGWIVQPFPMTIWFICMIFVFYLLNPLIAQKNSVAAMFMAIGIEIGFYCLYITFETDARMHFYWIFYAFGSFSRRSNAAEILENIALQMKESRNDSKVESFRVTLVNLFCRYLLLGCFPAFVFISISSGTILSYRSIVVGFFFIIALYMISSIASSSKKLAFLHHIARAGSYASLCVFLFHRLVFFELCQHFGGKFSIMVAYVAALPTVFIIGYFIQFIYDSFIIWLGKMIRHQGIWRLIFQRKIK